MVQSALPVYIVVPEQYTLQTEKELLAALGVKGFIQARVTSPTRLAEEVFAQVEQDRRAVVGECGLAMALRAAANKVEGELQAFGPVLGFSGFSAGMVRLIAEMKRFDVKPDDLRAASASARGALRAKAGDIAAIYSEYDRYLESHRYMDGEDRFNSFVAGIAKASFLRDCNFYFDGFDILSPQHCRMIGELIAISASVSVTLDYDGFESEPTGLFAAAERNIARLSAIASELGAAVRWTHVRAGDRLREMPPDVRHLEHSLFSLAGEPAKSSGGVTFCRAADSAEEAEAAAVWILERVREDRLRWRELAVQCADLEALGPVISRVFERYGIPVFIDSRKAIGEHPAVRFLLSLIRLIERDFRADDALRLVKTGYAGVDEEAAERLEVYLAAFAMRGAGMWAKDWTRGQDAYDLTELNESRKAVYELAQALKTRTGKKAAGGQWARALYELLAERKLDERLDREAAELKRAGLLEAAAVAGRVWNAVVDVLDQLDEIIGSETMDAAAFRAILESGFDSAEEGILPTGVDQVQVGSIGRSKYSGLKYMLLLGATEGSLTESRGAGGILTGRDIDALLELGVEVGRGSALQSAQKRFALYEAVTKGSRGLYISWPASPENDGSPERFVQRMMELLQVGPEAVLDGAALAARPAPVQGSFGRLPALLREGAEGTLPDGNGLALLGWCLANSVYESRVKALNQTVAGEGGQDILPAVSLALGGVASVTVSQLESFGNCPFRHFVEYVLTPQSWREQGVGGADAGRYLHAAMERFGGWLGAMRFDVSQLDETAVAAAMAKEARRLAEEFDYGLLRRSARLKWTGDNLERVCSVAAVTFLQQLVYGEFRPFGQELRFGRGGMPTALLRLPDGTVCHLQGRIDRLDICNAGEEDLFRVIDYKSGRSSIDVTDAVNGLDLQTWLYLLALRSLWGKVAGRKGKPAAAYIFPLADPWVDEGPDEEGERRKELRLRGWCLKDREIAGRMDREAAGGKSELYNFNLSRGTGVYEQNAVDEALRLVEENAIRSVSDIRRGRVGAYPWRQGKDTACDSCPWGALCRFGVRGEKPHRQLLDKESVMRLLGGAGEVSGDGMDG